MVTERSFESVEAAATELAFDLAVCLREAIAGRGHALLAVSGRRTPQCVFARLRKLDVEKYERAKLPGSPRELPLRLLLLGEHSSLNVLSAP